MFTVFMVLLTKPGSESDATVRLASLVVQFTLLCLADHDDDDGDFHYHLTHWDN